MTTLDWIKEFFKLNPEAWMNVLAYSAGFLITLWVFELIKKIIIKLKKDNKK